MSVHVPVQHRPPNRFLEHEIRPFTDQAGNTGRLRIAHFLNDKKKRCEIVAQVLWDTPPFSCRQ